MKLLKVHQCTGETEPGLPQYRPVLLNPDQVVFISDRDDAGRLVDKNSTFVVLATGGYMIICGGIDTVKQVMELK